MAFSVAGLSTLGVKASYAVETVAGTKPSTGWLQLERLTSIGGLSLSTEQIDVTAIEDVFKRYAAGQQDTGGNIEIGFNVTPEVIAQIEKLFNASNTAKSASKATWLQISHDDMSRAFFIKIECPRAIPVPETSANSAWQITVNFIVSSYEGLANKVAFTQDSTINADGTISGN